MNKNIPLAIKELNSAEEHIKNHINENNKDENLFFKEILKRITNIKNKIDCVGI